MARGRKPGTVEKGSMSYHVAKLAIGEALLVNDSPSYENYQASIQLTIKRGVASGALKGCYSVDTCYGLAAGMDEKPFKFFRVVRTH